MKLGYISFSRLRSAMAFVLMLWCAGTGCLAHGMAMAGSALVPGNKTATNLNQADMAMNGHACCKARHRSLRNASPAQTVSDGQAKTIALPEDSSPDGAGSCCPLTSGSFVVTSRTQTSGGHSSALTETVLNKPIFVLPLYADRAIPQRLPNHEPTYLTCCALLI